MLEDANLTKSPTRLPQEAPDGKSSQIPAGGNIDRFKQRLAEIEGEVSVLLDAGQKQRTELLARPTRTAFDHNPTTTTNGPFPTMYKPSSASTEQQQQQAQLHRDPFTRYPTGLMQSSSELIRREVQDAISREMLQYDQHVAEVVAREWDMRIKELDALLRNRFAELKYASDSMNNVVLELSEVVCALRDEHAKRLNSIEQDIARRFSELKRERAESQRLHEAEFQEMKDTVSELQASLRVGDRTSDKRFDELLRKNSEVLHHALATVDSRVLSARNHFEEVVGEYRKRHAMDVEALTSSFLQLQRNAKASDDATGKMFGQISKLFDDYGAQRSELRSCRNDINRVEVALRSMHLDPPSNFATRSQKDQRGGAGNMAIPSAEFFHIHQEIFSLKQSVAYLGEQLEEIQSRAQQPPFHYRGAEEATQPEKTVRSQAKQELKLPRNFGSSAPMEKGKMTEAANNNSNRNDLHLADPHQLPSQVLSTSSEQHAMEVTAIGVPPQTEHSPVRNDHRYEAESEDEVNSKLARSSLD